MDFTNNNDEAVQRAWHGWVVFTRMTAIAVLGAVGLLVLMALVLL